MDLIQRLIAGSGSAASKQQQKLPSHQERLGACKRLCNALHQIWRSSTSLANDETAASHVANIIRRLNTILEEESRKAAPHSCMTYTASNQIYIILAKLAISSASPEVIDHTVKFFHFLINGEVDGVLDQRIFARSTTDLVKFSVSPASKVVGIEEEAALIELLFEVCTKIRVDPDILPAWFYPERPGKTLSQLEARRHQFPLFYILVDYVHYDGPIGDFARTALLYLTETAPRSRPLEKWMMESDLAHQMASGLSALYSQLSRQSVTISKHTLPILSFSDSQYQDDQIQHIHEDTGTDMRAFLAYLAFWQDTLSHCKSLEVRDTLLDSFQVLFVEQLLYPSLLESSDVVGGSTSAVILHLCRLLDSLEHEQLTTRMLSYLFATKSQPAVAKNHRTRNRLSMSRRRSMEQLASLALMADNPSPELFNLLDLIIFSLRSSNPQTVAATLKLITILLRRHHPHVKHQLFSLEALRPNSRQNLNDLNNTMLTLFDYASAICETKAMDQSYQAALQDVQTSMEHHSCLFDESANPSSEMNQMMIANSCKVVDQMAVLLESWFCNDTLVNLELTGSLSTLATCEHILMRSWLTPAEDSASNIMSVLRQLIDKVRSWRAQFVEWDAFYSIQKVELSNEDDAHSLGLTPREIPHRSVQSPAEVPSPGTSPARSPRLVPEKLGTKGMGSIDSRVASNSSTAVDSSDSRRVSGQSRDHIGSDASTRTISSGNLSATLLETRIPMNSAMPKAAHHDSDNTKGAKAEATNGKESGVGETAIGDDEDKSDDEEQATASLRHVLTQAIILQEFILELAAALQIRATLFDEVNLS